MIINQANLAELYKSYRVIYEKAFQAAEPQSGQLAQEVPSTVRTGVYAWLGAFPGMKKLVDVATINRLKAHKFSIENEEWEDTIEVPEFDIESDQYGVYNARFQGLGDVAAYHPDELLADLLVNGFNADRLDYTGTPFFSADKKSTPDAKVTFTNAGTDALSRDAFRAARANLKARRNSEGRSMGLGRKLLLVVGSTKESIALDILKGETINLSATLDGSGKITGIQGGGTNVDKDSAELLVWPLIDTINPNFWCLLEQGLPGMKPLIHQVNLRPRLVSCNQPNDSYVLTHHKYLFQAYGRYNAGYGWPELAYGSTGNGTPGVEVKTKK